MEPFRELLKPSTVYDWTDELEDAFIKSKQEIICLIKNGVKQFKPDHHTYLSTDFSKAGLGRILQQKRCECTVYSHHSYMLL